ncbi:Cys-tRNA(Pro) deacylase [Cytobacillus gottheilii]|uniref:Cys-tRNA(Pro) deacylase n=1 Tax=Cytobacillus gottheilii TaxID=859144 RepID=UPI0024946AA0|nr:Cys-tRNA(Pro) deacylase [Cytobacillus gottheilii]
MAKGKTNAMRFLDSHKVHYEFISYEINDGKIDGISVAEKIKKDPEMVYKTLVLKGSSNGVYVFIVPVEKELDLKKAAKAAEEKKIEMVPVNDIQKLTGYIRGGCSPLGMKKMYPTFLAQEAGDLHRIIVSGGRIGAQIELETEELIKAISAKLAEITTN